MWHRLHEPLLTLPVPISVSLPSGTRHQHTTAVANTSEAYRLITAPEQCWMDHTEHPARKHCQKSLRIDGNSITVHPPR